MHQPVELMFAGEHSAGARRSVSPPARIRTRFGLELAQGVFDVVLLVLGVNAAIVNATIYLLAHLQ
ncbi:hypothetical protein [Rhodanobacter umsongensis]